MDASTFDRSVKTLAAGTGRRAALQSLGSATMALLAAQGGSPCSLPNTTDTSVSSSAHGNVGERRLG
jgi:hypothetical protein